MIRASAIARRTTVFCGLIAAASFGVGTSRIARANPPRPGDERLILHTVAGDLAFDLYDEAAPATVDQLKRLVRAGVYDSTEFFRVEAGFVAQVANAEQRRVPLTRAQAEAIVPIPFEPASSRPHERGALSLARNEDDLTSARTSFSVLLGPAPHLDGKYTIFGKLAAGGEVLELIERVPVDAWNRPLERIEITRAELWPRLPIGTPEPRYSPANLAWLERARANQQLAARDLRAQFARDLPALAALVAIAGIALIAMTRAKPRFRAYLRTVILLSAVMLFLLALRYAPLSASYGGAIAFFGVVLLFRLMSRFENDV